MELIVEEACENFEVVTGVKLSRTNLEGLLAKLNGFPPDSSCTLEKDGFTVTAEQDHVHYRGRVRGRMHEETERAVRVVRAVNTRVL